MEEQLQRKTIGHTLAMGQKTISYIPTACQNNSMNADDNRCVHNENMSWLVERGDRLPIWSRLKLTNCLGQNRNLEFTKQKHYDIEIPNRLFSIFGTPSQQNKVNEKMLGMEKYQMINCCLALCAALKYNLDDWTPSFIDAISTWGAELYAEHLKKLKLTNDEFNLKYINNLYHFDKTYFRVQSHKVATGFFYIRYGRNEFNLARALTWFFSIYQFGIIHCYNRTIAFGFNVDEEYGFFMYDCQSKGAPLFAENQTNSYVLRTNHLQVLLYCLIISLNVSLDRIQFYIYNVDVRIENPQENKTIIYNITKKFADKKIDNRKMVIKNDSEDKKDKEENVMNDTNRGTSTKSSPGYSVTNENLTKLNNNKNSVVFNEENLRTLDVGKALSTSKEREQRASRNESVSCSFSIASKQSSIFKVKNQQQPTSLPLRQQENKSISQSANPKNTPPLVPPKPENKDEAASIKLDISSSPNPLGFKLYMVDDRNSSNPFLSTSQKIKVVNQLSDLF